MAINRDFKPYVLQIDDGSRSESGARKSRWVDCGTVDAAVYQNDQRVNYGSEVYKDTTHTGLTYDRTIKAKKHRLVRAGVVYLVQYSNPMGRLTQIGLKVIEGGG